MCKQFIFWATEYLNYYSLIFWGIKLFLKKYDVKTGRKEWIENVIIIVVSAPVVWLCADNYRFMKYSNIVSYILVLYINVFIKIYTKGKVKKFFLLSATYIQCMRLIDLLVVAIVLEVNRVSRYANWDIIDFGIARSIFMICLAISYYMLYRLMYQKQILFSLFENELYKGFIWLYSMIGIFCFCRVYQFEYMEQLIQYWTFYLVCLFIFAGLFIYYFVKIKEEEKERILNMRNDFLESGYQSLRKAYDENRMMYHDFKNHMLVVNELIQEEKNKEALEYINTYIHRTLSINRRVGSGCKIIDIIVNCKNAEAVEKCIKFTYEIDYIGEIGIADIDMCALLANLLDNAIEACEKIDEEKRRIDLKIKRVNDMLFIWSENSMKEVGKERSNFFRTNKENKILHGLGVKSIDNVVKKYDGHKEYEIQKDRFRIYISIPTN
ncbi:sensor histidine kinase [Frisingicoccus sp.]|uniref:sensor histidine kinase n=1 Tax=Frisingicoccus sp. TaxID=1918627 RepID=UPI003AB72855